MIKQLKIIKEYKSTCSTLTPNSGQVSGGLGPESMDCISKTKRMRIISGLFYKNIITNFELFYYLKNFTGLKQELIRQKLAWLPARVR